MYYNNLTYRKWLKIWIDTYKKPYIKTWRTIQRHIENHFYKYILDTKLVDLSIIDIQRNINSITNSRTRLEIYDIFHGSLKCAYRLDLITKDLSDRLIKPRHSRVIGSALTSSELNDFLSSISSTRCRFVFLFLLYTGTRRTEALNVTWEDIDFKNMLIHIKGTKTRSSNRYIPLFPELSNILSAIPCKVGKLFHHKKDWVTRKFKEYCPNHKLHDLRHTFATRCFECGISMNTIQRWLGHTRLETTSSIYTHVMPDFINFEASKFTLYNEKKQ